MAPAPLPTTPPPEVFRTEAFFDYDTARHPIIDTLRGVLLGPGGSDLSRLHETQLGRRTTLEVQRRVAAQNPLDKGRSKVVALGPKANPWNRLYRNCDKRDPEAHAAFMEAFHGFVRDVVLAQLGTHRVAFQTEPSFRCHLPGCGAGIGLHCDEEYGHSNGEINFWVPITPAFESNSLYTERRRGTGNFRPFELQPGQAARFYGNQVLHYTVPNETCVTRVSLDFRVIREEEWTSAAFSHFPLGGYFSVMCAKEGMLPKTSPEMLRLLASFDCPPSLSPATTTASLPQQDSYTQAEQSYEEEESSLFS